MLRSPQSWKILRACRKNYGADPVSPAHVIYDVLPYWIWGNSEKDPTPFWDRVLGPGEWPIAMGQSGIILLLLMENDYYGLALPLHASRGNGTFAVYSTYIGIDHLCFGGKIRKRIRSYPEPRIFYRLSAMGWHRVRF